ncbi:MAG TPA: AMP-binding protein, partial [Pyrinomonadaceae bacterium]|nr:AMP-binding protein [Pyrinomonadaceae bacterium]
MISNTSGRLIGLMVDSTPQLLLGMLGILKSGNGFVPVDPRYPEERISFIIADCELEILIVQEKYLDQALRAAGHDSSLKQIICLDDAPNGNGNSHIKVYDRQDFTARPSLVQTDSRPDKLAYVIYTSGSTGKPKGVPITHSNLAPILLWGCDYFKLGSHTKTLQVLSYCFDFGVFDLLTTLLAGGTVHFFDRQSITGAFRYSELINSRAINTLHCTPSSFKEMMNSGERMETLKTLHLGGEQLTRSTIEQLSGSLGDDCVIYNGYGPTEASV